MKESSEEAQRLLASWERVTQNCLRYLSSVGSVRMEPSHLDQLMIFSSRRLDHRKALGKTLRRVLSNQEHKRNHDYKAQSICCSRSFKDDKKTVSKPAVDQKVGARGGALPLDCP